MSNKNKWSNKSYISLNLTCNITYRLYLGLERVNSNPKLFFFSARSIPKHVSQTVSDNWTAQTTFVRRSLLDTNMSVFKNAIIIPCLIHES